MADQYWRRVVSPFWVLSIPCNNYRDRRFVFYFRVYIITDRSHPRALGLQPTRADNCCSFDTNKPYIFMSRRRVFVRWMRRATESTDRFCNNNCLFSNYQTSAPNTKFTMAVHDGATKPDDVWTTSWMYSSNGTEFDFCLFFRFLQTVVLRALYYHGIAFVRKSHWQSCPEK